MSPEDRREAERIQDLIEGWCVALCEVETGSQDACTIKEIIADLAAARDALTGMRYPA